MFHPPVISAPLARPIFISSTVKCQWRVEIPREKAKRLIHALTQAVQKLSDNNAKQPGWYSEAVKIWQRYSNWKEEHSPMFCPPHVKHPAPPLFQRTSWQPQGPMEGKQETIPPICYLLGIENCTNFRGWKRAHFWGCRLKGMVCHENKNNKRHRSPRLHP